MPKRNEVKFICGCIMECVCNGGRVVLNMVVTTLLLGGARNDTLVETAALGHCLMERCITKEELVHTVKFVVKL